MELRNVPHSDEAEKGVLGSVLLDPSSLDRVTVDADSFYDRRHQVLFASMVEMSQSGKPMDALTIGDWLKGRGEIDTVGGYDYLVELQDSEVVCAHVEFYSKIIKEKKLRRSLIESASESIELAYRNSDDATELINHAVTNMLGIIGMEENGDSLDVLGEKFLEDCKNGEVGHFPWWCGEWTSKLGRLSTELMLLHAPRSTGKTALMLQWMIESHRGKQRTPLASIEMQKRELVPRLISNIGNVSTFTMKVRGSVTYDEEGKAKGAINEIRALEFCVRENSMSIDDIFTWAVSEMRKKPIHAVFVDNLLSISDGGRDFRSKTEMYDHFMRKFRDLRDLLQVPLIVLAHPNDEGRIAWSKDAENFADIILYLHENTGDNIKRKNGSVYGLNPNVLGKHIIGSMQKCRQGIQPVAHLDFVGSTQRFRHISWDDD